MALARSIMLFIAILSTVTVIFFAQKCKHSVLKCAAGALSGIAALGAVNLLAPFTGVGLILNYYSAFISVVLGAPGVVMMLILRVVLIL